MKYWTRVARSAGCGVSGRRIIAAGTGGCGARRDVSSIEDDRNLGACAGRKRAHDTCGCRVVGFGFASGRRCIASGPEALGCLHSLPADTLPAESWRVADPALSLPTGLSRAASAAGFQRSASVPSACCPRRTFVEAVIVGQLCGPLRLATIPLLSSCVSQGARITQPF